MAEQRRKKPQSIRIAERDIRLAEQDLKDAKATGSATAVEAAEDRLQEARAALRRIRKAEPGEERQEARREFMQDYYERLGPEVANLARTDPELRKLFDEAIRKGWDAQTFNSELKKTDWWKDPKKGLSWRQAFELEFNNPPGVWQEALRKAKQQIRDLAQSRYGMVLPEDVLDKIARRYYYQGWNTDPRGLEVWLAGQLDKQQEDPEAALTPGGMYMDYERSLRDAVRGFGVQRTEDWYAQTAEAILNPNSGITEDSIWNEIIAEAESLYPALAGKLSKDRSVRDAVNGYFAWAAQILEIDPESMELTDPALSKALGYSGADGNPTLMPLWEYRKELRKDPRWQQTDNARSSYSDLASTFLRSMGAIG